MFKLISRRHGVIEQAITNPTLEMNNDYMTPEILKRGTLGE